MCTKYFYYLTNQHTLCVIVTCNTLYITFRSSYIVMLELVINVRVNTELKFSVNKSTFIQ